MKLYAVCDGPPSLACRMTLEHLKIPFELVEVDFNKGEHLTADYAKVFKNNLIAFVGKLRPILTPISVESSTRNPSLGR